MQRDNSTLQLMGIQAWELSHPDRITRQYQPTIELPADCRLLFVSPHLPAGELAQFYQKIVTAMKLTLEQTCHVLPEHLPYVDLAENLVWIWFAGVKESDHYLQSHKALANLPTKLQSLHSPELMIVQNSDGEKRQLWNQIRAYE